MYFEMPSCGGCRTCEMACSFHHRKLFAPEISSIRIFEKKGEPGFRVWIAEQNAGTRIACDGCLGHAIPLCVQYCKSSMDLMDIVKELDKGALARKGGEESQH